MLAFYQDKDCGADCPASELDSASDRAPVLDNQPPGQAQSFLVVTSGPNGRSIDLDWSAYDEASQGDVAGYRVVVQTASFDDVAGLPYATVPAGTFTYTTTGLTPGAEYWVAVIPVDEVPNLIAGVAAKSVVTGDSVAPSLSEIQPGDLVFYYSPVSHVALYIGNGKIVHARNVSSDLVVQTLASYPAPWAGARRILG